MIEGNIGWHKCHACGRRIEPYSSRDDYFCKQCEKRTLFDEVWDALEPPQCGTCGCEIELFGGTFWHKGKPHCLNCTEKILDEKKDE